jgi:Leucine-rich repeat (LRR) protein
MNCISSGESLTRLKTVNIRLKNPLYKPKRIYLRYNSIDVFERNKLISGQEKDVEYLGLQNNQLIRIEDAAFDTFELKSLHLSNNFLKLDSSGKYVLSFNIYFGIFRNWLTEKLGSTLQILSLDNNLIELLPDQIFDNLISLDTLILKNNPSLGLSDNVFGTNIRNLRELSLSSCNLNSIPPLLFRNLV